jgi:hypothetical protein
VGGARAPRDLILKIEMELPDWVERARYVANPVLEVAFTIREDFYYGPANDFSPEQWQTLREPLPKPSLELYHHDLNRVLTAVAERTVGELVRHYRHVLRLAEKHAMEVPPSHFWITPFLFAGDVTIQFAWHDTRRDAERLFDALEASADGLIYDDVDQGWELDIWARGDRLFIRDADFDTQEERACIWCERAPLVRQVAPLRARLDTILAQLREALGADYWSRGGRG